MNYLLAVIGSECQQRRENRIERLLVDHGHIRRLLLEEGQNHRVGEFSGAKGFTHTRTMSFSLLCRR